MASRGPQPRTCEQSVASLLLPESRVPTWPPVKMKVKYVWQFEWSRNAA